MYELGSQPRAPLYWSHVDHGCPFRETEEAIAACRAKGILAVEMEAAALYAMASARQKDVVCFAHVTNQKGQAQGSMTALQVLNLTVKAWQANGRSRRRAASRE